jgi:hypothetical protein
MIRQWHSYIGMFIAPSVLFFALTGSAQIFNLHEAHGDYQPAAIIEKLSRVHKDQVFALGEHHDGHHAPVVQEPAAAPADMATDHPNKPAADEKAPKLSTQLLKWFFLVVAVGLIVTTLFGLWMGLTRLRGKRLAWILFIAGAIIPLGLLLL